MRNKSWISGLALNGTFLVSGFLSLENFQYLEDAEIFDPETNCWHCVDLDLGGRQDGLFVRHGELCSLDMTNGTLHVYDEARRTWKGTLNEPLGGAMQQGKLAVKGDDLFVISSRLAVAKTSNPDTQNNGGPWVEICRPVVNSEVALYSCHFLTI
jgi:hypothetical protein